MTEGEATDGGDSSARKEPRQKNEYLGQPPPDILGQRGRRTTPFRRNTSLRPDDKCVMKTRLIVFVRVDAQPSLECWVIDDVTTNDGPLNTL